MKAILLLIAMFSFANAAQALSKIYDYHHHVPSRAKNYLSMVDRNASPEGAPVCSSMYTDLLRDDVLDVRYALGYFDDSTGEERVWNGVNWGYSPSLDIAVYETMISTLTAPCRSRTQRLCDFEGQGVPHNGRMVFHKRMPIHGRNILVRVTLTHASASESFEQNKGSLAERQQALTAQSETNFFGGLKRADVVFYNGHSRDGGGPDFAPPVLNSKMKTNYGGYYQVKRPGIKRTMASLAEHPDQGPVVGFFSCYARLHFHKTFMSADPNQKMILSADTIDYFDAFEASLGYLEGMLRGSCGDDLDNTARQTEKVRRGFQSWNLR